MTLRDLAREAVEELRRTQFRDETRASLGHEPYTVRACTSCGCEVRIPGSPMKGDGAHLCPRTLLIADLEAALRDDR